MPGLSFEGGIIKEQQMAFGWGTQGDNVGVGYKGGALDVVHARRKILAVRPNQVSAAPCPWGPLSRGFEPSP